MHTMPSGHDPSPRRTSRPGVARLLGLAGLAATVMAIVQELRRPRAERSWQGKVLGFVPYDLRPPTVARLRDSVWQPASPRWFLPRSFGVGWSPNLARIAAVLPRRR